MTSETENKKKLETFFDKEYHSLKLFVNSRIKASTDRDAEDIIQDVALKLFSGADRYTPINNVAGFVYHSVKNKIIDVMRKRKRNTNADDENEEKLIEISDLLYGNSDNGYSQQMQDELKRTIADLKEPFRDIITAFDLEGYSYKEISQETGIPEGTLMSRRHRALSQLHKELENKKETDA